MARTGIGPHSRNETVRRLSRRILTDHLKGLRARQESGEELSNEQMMLVKDCWKITVQDRMLTEGVTPLSGLSKAQVIELHKQTLGNVYSRIIEEKKKPELAAPGA